MLTLESKIFHSKVSVCGFLALIFCLLALVGCNSGNGSRYFYGKGKVVTRTPSDPVSDNVWVAVLFKVKKDGSAEIKFGAMGGAVKGTGVLTQNRFSGQVTQDRGAGTVKLTGILEEPSNDDEVAVIAGTITRNAGESGEFAAGEIEDGKDAEELWDYY